MTGQLWPTDVEQSTVVRGANGLGMTGHHLPTKGKNDEWLTPPAILEALGPFDLDPCAPIGRPWDTAHRHLTIEDDGLSARWAQDELVWMNPPYGQQTWTWLDKLHEHPAGGVALIFARTETAGFFRSVWAKAQWLLFLEGRLHFHYVNGERAAANAGAPSVLIAYGSVATDRVRSCKLAGAHVDHWHR